MLPLTVLSWDFHTQPNLVCLDVLAAGHSWRQEQRPGVSPGGGSRPAPPQSSAWDRRWGTHSAHLIFEWSFGEGGVRSLSLTLFFCSCEITGAC